VRIAPPGRASQGEIRDTRGEYRIGAARESCATAAGDGPRVPDVRRRTACHV
jgi:hypothetical protein